VNSIGGDGASAIADALKTNKTLTALYLNSMLPMLLFLIAHEGCILTGNIIGADGARAIVDALKTNNALTTLNLACTLLLLCLIAHREGVLLQTTILARMVPGPLRTHSRQTRHSPHWISLVRCSCCAGGSQEGCTFTDNKIGADGAKVISDALKTNNTLTTLDLCGNSFGCMFP